MTYDEPLARRETSLREDRQDIDDVLVRYATGIDRRDWVVGTPDDAIAWIEAKKAELGEFGGIMITTHEWTETSKIRKSLELFARYGMPHFQGYTQDFHDQWKRVQDENAKGWPKLAKSDDAYNLAAKA